MNITKAIIPVAGWGSRMLPITKAIDKCMLPIGNRPIVDYVVQDCVKAGITDIYFVVDGISTQLKDYYSRNERLESYLRANGKDAMLPLVAPIEGVNFHYVTQDTTGAYGTAIPVSLVADQIEKDESVLVLMGDDFIYNRDGSSEASRLIEAAGNDSAMLGVNVEKDQVSRYGVLDIGPNSEFIKIVEKPAVEDAPSTLINVSKYVVTYDLLQRIVEFSKTEHEGEYYITDPINDFVNSGKTMKVVPAQGQYLDGGTVEGWINANNIVAGSA